MLFNSSLFLVFLPVVIILYYLIKPSYRWVLLLASSYFFYMCWKAEFAVLILASTVVDFFVAKQIEKSDTKKRKRLLLLISLFANLGLLFVFKYLDFFIGNINAVFDAFTLESEIPYMKLLLPVGISFYTFQTLSYTLDIYYGRIKSEKHFGKFAVFVSFWPQLVAGPIERASHLIPELNKKVQLNYDNFVWGTSKIVYGFFKKVVVADRLAIYVDSVYKDIPNASSIGVGVASVLFAFQIYCDFSGYSDIAIGSARLMGIDLMENFKRPYLAKSFSDFWARWHISLSTWFRDYVYIPLGGNRVVKWRWYYNLFLTFLISGLWHGNNWTYIIWGSIHGSFLIAENVIKAWNINIVNWFRRISILRIVAVFIMVTVAWVFFRANNTSDALLVFNKLWHFDGDFSMVKLCAYKGPLNLLLSFMVIGMLLLSYLIRMDLNLKNHKIFIILTLIIIFFLGKNGDADFIYFQF